VPIGVTEVLIIAAVALLIFGPRQLPRLGRAVADAIREFRGAGKEMAKGLTDDDD